MNWKIKDFGATDPKRLEELMVKDINENLNSAQRRSCKIAISDMYADPVNSRGFYVYNADAEPSGEPLKLEILQTGVDYKDLYRKVVNKMNELSESSAQHARITFTNAKGRIATVAIFHPSS